MILPSPVHLVSDYDGFETLPRLIRRGSNAGHFSHGLHSRSVSCRRHDLSTLTKHNEEHAATGDQEHPNTSCSASIR